MDIHRYVEFVWKYSLRIFMVHLSFYISSFMFPFNKNFTCVLSTAQVGRHRPKFSANLLKYSKYLQIIISNILFRQLFYSAVVLWSKIWWEDELLVQRCRIFSVMVLLSDICTSHPLFKFFTGQCIQQINKKKSEFYTSSLFQDWQESYLNWWSWLLLFSRR